MNDAYFLTSQFLYALRRLDLMKIQTSHHAFNANWYKNGTTSVLVVATRPQ